MPPSDSTPRRQSPSGQRPRAKRVLMIEDDEAARELLAYALQRAGLVVLDTADGEAGLHEVGRFRPDVIVLDLMLPKLNGFAVARAVQTLEFEPRVAIIAVSGLTSDALRAEALAAGCDVFLTKPVRVDLVIEHARRLADQGQSRGVGSRS